MFREELTFEELTQRFLSAHAAICEASTVATLRGRLRRPLAAFGSVRLSELEACASEIAMWQATLPPRYRYAVMRSMRQVLDAGVRWQMIGIHPAKMAGPNPEPPVAEVLTFASVEEIDRLSTELGAWGSMVMFAAETGLRPSEWIALEWRDISHGDGVVTVNRTFAKARLRDYGKTARSRRRVPLTARALDALAATPRRLDRRLIFPASQGGYLDLNNFRRREWAPALEAAGLPGRTIYALRHTFASFALDAGVSIFELARFMGTGVRMIDRTYGHLVRGSENQVRFKLEARTARDLADVGERGAPEPRADGLNRDRR